MLSRENRINPIIEKPKQEYTVTVIYGKIFLLPLIVTVIRKNISLLPLL